MEQPLRFALRELAETVTEREVTVSGAEIDLPMSLRTEGPVMVTLEFTRARERVHVRGAARVRVRLTCVRCTADVAQELRAPFEIVAERPPEGSETGAEAPDGIVYYGGDAIDLTDEIREVLVLEIPTHPLCRDDCRGLCARCGADLNQDACGCSAAEPSDPRWAALKSLHAEGSDSSLDGRLEQRDS